MWLLVVAFSTLSFSRSITFFCEVQDDDIPQFELEQLQVGNWSYIWSKVFRRSADVVTVAQNKFKEVVHAIRRDGDTVESYIIPIILDERAAKSHFLQRVTGIVGACTGILFSGVRSGSRDCLSKY
eukprot:TRINITY_DN1129_c0_g1_i20.p2 TRINITY_DN1129_c0_g1~~TRINITY_DN1129_c0_g1_i20.p2  ORF type:complete len:126 (+),score=13.73 TRINITY_DN1129_c0_g1_i20:10-387(+)